VVTQFGGYNIVYIIRIRRIESRETALQVSTYTNSYEGVTNALRTFYENLFIGPALWALYKPSRRCTPLSQEFNGCHF